MSGIIHQFSSSRKFDNSVAAATPAGLVLEELATQITFTPPTTGNVWWANSVSLGTPTTDRRIYLAVGIQGTWDGTTGTNHTNDTFPSSFLVNGSSATYLYGLGVTGSIQENAMLYAINLPTGTTANISMFGFDVPANIAITGMDVFSVKGHTSAIGSSSAVGSNNFFVKSNSTDYTLPVENGGLVFLYTSHYQTLKNTSWSTTDPNISSIYVPTSENGASTYYKLAVAYVSGTGTATFTLAAPNSATVSYEEFIYSVRI